MSYYDWKPYVRVADRLANAERKMKKLQKKGLVVQPVAARKHQKIASTFWGKYWCDHIESFYDYENRLPRGRTYVRNGSVCHLAIDKGQVTAFVVGSEIYQVDIMLKPLTGKKWQAIKSQCHGKIGSLLELLSGELSEEVMSAVCNSETGLFPKANEFEMQCNCPDWASMCKHIAAVFYGVGARLDNQPSHLFKLRGVDHQELVNVNASISKAIKGGQSHKRRRIADSALADVFDINIPLKASIKTTSFPKNLTGAAVKKKRLAKNMSQVAFAKVIGVSATTIARWEKLGRKHVKPRADLLLKLKDIWE